MNRSLLFVAASLLLSGCISDAPIKPKPKVYQPKNAYRVEGAPIVFQGTVQSVLPSPGGLSIVTSFFQGVKYRVDKVESGQMSRGNVTVYHMLVGPPMTEKDSPELSHTMFAPGTKVRVRCQKTHDGEYVDTYGVNTVEVIK